MKTYRRVTVVGLVLTLALGAGAVACSSLPPPPKPSYPGAAHWMAVHFPKGWHDEGLAAERFLVYRRLPGVAAPAGRRFLTWSFSEPISTTWHGRVIRLPKFAVIATEVSPEHRQKIYGEFLGEGSPVKWMPWPNW